MKKCLNCGAELTEDAVFCSHCGMACETKQADGADSAVEATSLPAQEDADATKVLAQEDATCLLIEEQVFSAGDTTVLADETIEKSSAGDDTALLGGEKEYGESTEILQKSAYSKPGGNPAKDDSPFIAAEENTSAGANVKSKKTRKIVIITIFGLIAAIAVVLAVLFANGTFSKSKPDVVKKTTGESYEQSEKDTGNYSNNNDYDNNYNDNGNNGDYYNDNDDYDYDYYDDDDTDNIAESNDENNGGDGKKSKTTARSNTTYDDMRLY
ncbi:MAG: zinc ribbon domain-containing protein [Ruminococcaceae bacterium]|nr:zinc ribbon domain-containing protein [Oscillospiraceae bacterium]